MQEHDIANLEDNLRRALAIKAEDLLHTLGGDEGAKIYEAFLGIPYNRALLSTLLMKQPDLATIDLDRFRIAEQVRALHEMLETLSLGLRPWQQSPDAETIQHEALYPLEGFLSALPSMARGIWDTSSVRDGPLRSFFDDCAAWANLVEAIERAFEDEGDLYIIRVADLARLSGVELRTMRNRVGPMKPIRTAPQRSLKYQELRGSSFVGVNTLDALVWLSGRQKVVTSIIDPSWVETVLEEARDPRTIGRAPIVLALINEDPLPEIAERLGWSEQKLKLWAERGPNNNADDAKALAHLADLCPDTYAAKCAAVATPTA